MLNGEANKKFCLEILRHLYTFSSSGWKTSMSAKSEANFWSFGHGNNASVSQSVTCE